MTPATSQPPGSRAPARLSAFLRGGALSATVLAAWTAASPASAATGQVSKLTDVTFSALNPLVSASSAQNVCAYSGGVAGGYSITGTGSGSVGAFTLSGGGGLTLRYAVQWSSSSGAASGSSLTPGVALTGQTSATSVPGCTIGPVTTATLIVTLAAADLQAAAAGVTYTGSLTLLLTPQ